MAYSQIAAFDVLRVLAFGSISATYAKIGSAMTHNPRLICISNNTNGDIFVSITNGSTPASDTTADNIFVPGGGFKLIDITSNTVIQQPSVFCIIQGSQFWVRQSSAPTSGSVYLEVMYGLNET